MRCQRLSSRNAGGQLYSELPKTYGREVEGESITMRKQRKGSVNGPTTSQINQPGSTLKYLPCREWTFKQLKALVHGSLGIDCSNTVAFGLHPKPGVFVVVNNKNGANTIEPYALEFVGDRLYIDGNTLGDVLANIQHGGDDALELYISARQRSGILSPYAKIESIIVSSTPSTDMS